MLNNQQITKQLSENSQAAFEQLFNEYYEELCHYALRFIHDNLDAEEVVQNSFVKLWDRRAKAGEIKSIKAYLYRTVHNACLNFIEHQKVKQQYVSETENSLRNIELQAFEETYNLDLGPEMTKAIESLPPKNQEVFKLRYFDGLRHKEIAQQLNISERTVETHIAKSMRILRDKLKYLLTIAIFFPFI